MKHSFLIGALLALAWPAQAHEFWIEPEAYMVAPGDEVTANIRVGETFRGSAYTYNPRTFERFEAVTDGEAAAIEGRPGDRPAARLTAEDDGLLVLLHETTDLHLTYTEQGKFEAFLRHKDWLGLMEDHRSRGLPETGFRERYSRYGKSLVAIGSGAGADSRQGLATEIVALTNPYVDATQEMRVQVFYGDAPRRNAQVELFEKAPDESVVVTLHRTDDEGIAAFPVKAGHSYLVDAVVIRAFEPVEERDPVWESLWASLTFAVP